MSSAPSSSSNSRQTALRLKRAREQFRRDKSRAALDEICQILGIPVHLGRADKLHIAAAAIPDLVEGNETMEKVNAAPVPGFKVKNHWFGYWKVKEAEEMGDECCGDDEIWGEANSHLKHKRRE
jgi:hypothetical protein